MLVYALDTNTELKVLKGFLDELCRGELEFVGFTDSGKLIGAAAERAFDAVYINLDYNAHDYRGSGELAARSLFNCFRERPLNIIGVSDDKNIRHAELLIDIYASSFIGKPYDREQLIATLKHLRFPIRLRDRNNPYIRYL